MTNDYKKLRKSVTLGTTFVFVVALLPFIAFLIRFCLNGCKQTTLHLLYFAA